MLITGQILILGMAFMNGLGFQGRAFENIQVTYNIFFAMIKTFIFQNVVVGFATEEAASILNWLSP